MRYLDSGLRGVYLVRACALFCVDWGRRTGVAEMVLPVAVQPRKEAKWESLFIKESFSLGKRDVWEVGGRKDGVGEDLVVATVMRKWREFVLDCRRRGLIPTFCQEMFVYQQPRSVRAGTRGSDPWISGRLASMARGWLLHTSMALPQIFEVPAGQAKTFATVARMREWGAWEVGKPHGRDAVRVGACALAKTDRRSDGS